MVANKLAGTVTILNTSTNAIVATVTVGEGPSDVAINTATNRAYVTNTFSDSVSVINLANNTVIATYPVGQNPDGIAVIPSVSLLLVVNVQGDTVYVINLNNPPGGTAVPVGRDPEGVAIDVDTNRAVTANAKSNDLSVVDLTNASELARIAVGKTPRDVAIHPDSHLLVVVNFRANTASIVDLPTLTMVATVPVGRRPLGVAIDPILNLAVVANERGNTLSLIDLATRTVTATLPAGSHPTDVAINPRTHVAVVANKKIDQVTLIDLANRVTIATVTVGKDPVSVAVNPVTNMAVVANEKAGTLSVLTLSPAAVTATIPVLARPTGVAINPSTNIAAVVGHTTNTLMLVDLATNTVQTTLPAGREPQQVTINPSTNIAAMTNEEPGALTILQLPNPVPVITSLVPVAVSAGDPGFTLTVNGSKLLRTSTVTFGTQTFPVQFVSNEQLRADIPASAIAAAGPVSVTVVNPSPGGGTSNSLTFTVNQPPNPVPVATSLTPASVTAGEAAFTLTVDGTGFISASSVVFNGQALTTTFVSAQRVTASVPAEAVGIAGTRPVTVVNPAPGGGTSNAITFTVNNPVPTTTPITPAAVTAGAADATVTVTGTNFVGMSVVQLDGTDLATVIVSGTQLQATIPAARQASAGIVSLTVVNPAPGGGTSNAQSVTVNNPNPTLATLSPATIVVGSAGVTLTLTGTNFVSTSTVTVGGTSLAATLVSATQLTTQVPASFLTAAGALLVTVTNPTPGGGTSNAMTLAVNAPLVVQFTTPTAGATLTGFIPVTAEASDSLSGIAQVEFFVDGVLQWTQFEPPFTFDLDTIQFPPGSYLLTARAVNGAGDRAEASISVSVQPQILVQIIDPADGSTVTHSPVLVSGYVIDNVPEVGISVNGVLAQIQGVEFAVEGIHLEPGSTTLTATATDGAGLIVTASAIVTVPPGLPSPPVTLNAAFSSSLAPAAVSFAVETALTNPIASYRLDFEGDGRVDLTNNTFIDVRHTYSTAGLYFPTLTVTDFIGNSYRATTILNLLDRGAIDAMLQSKWNAMVAALSAGNVEAALEFLTPGAQIRYRPTFEVLSADLPQIVATFPAIRLVNVGQGVAEYGIARVQRGVTRLYLIELGLDKQGFWKIQAF